VSLLLLDEAQAAGIGAELDEAALQDAIDEEEAWLARKIGPLVGERTERFRLTYITPLPTQVQLRRPTDSVEVEQDSTEVDMGGLDMLADGWVVGRLPLGTRFTGVLDITYTPNDELEVKRALKELLGLTLATQGSAGLSAEVMGSYSYARGAGTTTRLRRSIVRGLQAPPAAGTTRLLSSVRHGLAGAIGR
jgi:hypothetical protein